MRKNKEFDNTESRISSLINILKNKLNNDEELNKTYNRLLIERAVLRKKSESKKSNNILTSFCHKLNRKRHEKLICDYFNA